MATPPRHDAFPTFLDEDPYPNRSQGRPTSGISAATSATSEYEIDEYHSTKERHSVILGSAGPAGEPGLPPSRPSTGNVATSSPRIATQRIQAPPSSRRGLASFVKSAGVLRHGAPEGERPASAAGRTFVPSLTAQGFSRPMSSQKLQAQRGQRPGSALAHSIPGDDETQPSAESEKYAGAPHRYSNASLNTLRDGPPLPRGEDAPPLPVSRGTVFSDEGNTFSDSQAPDSIASNGSAVPLHNVRQPRPAGVILETRLSHVGSISKSQKSFRASIGLNSRQTSQRDSRPTAQHEKLHSDPSSPTVEDKELPPLPLSGRSFSAIKARSGKNYEYYTGNTVFFLAGRILNTRASPLNVVTFVLTALPATLFFGFSAPWLWHNVSPAIPIIFAYIFYITLSSFLHAAFSDPGILPRNLHPHPPNAEEADPLTVGPPTTEWVMVKTFPAQSVFKDRDEEAQTPVAATAMEVPTKFCKSCNIWRPPRAHHCRVCDACIETQDHHCVWLNNCVGRRNYRYFFSFVGFATLLAILLLAFTLTHISIYAVRHNISFGQSLSGRKEERVTFAMFLYSILALPYPGSLFCYHIFLTSRGETTREYLNSHKFLLKDRHRPFSQSSWLRNLLAVLTRPRPPTYLRFHHHYQVGDRRLGQTMTKKERKLNFGNRYSLGGRATEKDDEKGALEMMQLPFAPGKKRMIAKEPGIKSKGGRIGSEGVTAPIDRTPR
nr:palmitoyltransferase erf2 [Quercus suber]